MKKSRDYDESPEPSEEYSGETEEEKCMLDVPLSCSIEGNEQDGSCQLFKEYMIIFPGIGKKMVINYRSILGILGGDYIIQIQLTSYKKLVLFALGYKYDDFLRILISNRNELIIQDMLMYESKIFINIESEFSLKNESGAELQCGECILRLYETAILIIPQYTDPIRIPYGVINNIEEVDYSIAVITDIGEHYHFSKLGRELDGFKKVYSELTGKLIQKTSLLLTEFLPEADSNTVRSLLPLLRDGKAAKRIDIDKISEGLWESLEKELHSLGAGEEYSFLKGLAREDRICIGIKKGLMGDLTGEYMWFLIPVYSIDHRLPGNVIAMEAVDTGDGSRATYLFRIAGRKEYLDFDSMESLNYSADNFIRLLNYSMQAINFRREPIYLSEEQLKKPQYLRYQYSIERLPALKLLRKHFIGRAIHSSAEQWKRDVMDIINFNASSTSDAEVWKKSKNN